MRVTLQVCKVGKVLISCGKCVAAGNEVVMYKDQLRIVAKLGETVPMEVDAGTRSGR